MPDSATPVANRPAWVDLSSSDPAASRAFYAKVFGWDIQVSPDPQYGGYAMATVDGQDVAGIGPAQSPDAPTAWSLYVGTDNADELGRKVEAAGGRVIAPAFPVGDQGRMAVYQDPAGAFISAWEPNQMSGFMSGRSNSFGWAELNARNVKDDLDFYQQVFGWANRQSDMGPDRPPYNEFLLGGESVAGAWEMNPALPAEMPSYWIVYFDVDDVDASYKVALEAGAREMVSPTDFPGGRFAIVTDPQGASFGLLRTAAAQG